MTTDIYFKSLTKVSKIFIHGILLLSFGLNLENWFCQGTIFFLRRDKSIYISSPLPEILSFVQKKSSCFWKEYIHFVFHIALILLLLSPIDNSNSA